MTGPGWLWVVQLSIGSPLCEGEYSFPMRMGQVQ